MTRRPLPNRILIVGSGGYVLASVHNIQSEVPPANVMAMFNAARKWGTYSS